MQKLLLGLMFMFFSANASAKTIKIDSKSPENDPKKEAVSGLSQELLGIFTDQGLALKSIGNGKFALEVGNIHCDYRHRGAYADQIAGVPTTVCRRNSINERDSTKGTRLADSRALVDVLGKIQDTYDGEVFFTDCAMGYCGTFAKSVRCVVDTKIGNFSDGRFACTLDDGYNE